ncbi:MAG TPA: amidohydrolase family protein [Agriterribacter sp.]|nr:amidohydrolase family protein [Agriterribacter sp.]
MTHATDPISVPATPAKFMLERRGSNKSVFLVIALLITAGAFAQQPDSILLKNFRPKSIYKIPVSDIQRAKFPVIDMHTHPYAKTEADLKKWIALMDQLGVEKSVVLSYATGRLFDSIYQVYSKYGDRFEVWCGFDYTGINEPGGIGRAVKELERCAKVGARGVGELGDKGWGEFYSHPVPSGMHVDDPRIQPLFSKCGELGLPVSIHVAEPMWMYEPMDSTNDGLMNAYEWKVDQSRKGIIGHAALIQTLENVVRNNPTTTFIACHYANCGYDLSILGNLFSKYKNLYADISARFAEVSPIPRFTKSFFEKYSDRLLYGTDMGFAEETYKMTFRVLETQDEHFYNIDITGYHWPMNGLGLSEGALRRVYRENALKILKRK